MARQLPIPTGGLGCLLCVLLVASSDPAHAGLTFTVDSSADAEDAAPGDGLCTTLAGRCTLRAAVQETNAVPGADTVVLPTGTYRIAIPPAGADSLGGSFDATSNPATGDFDILDDLSIVGAGSESTIVDGGELDRVFSVVSTASVEISGLTIQHGSEVGGAGGGGIGSQGGVTLVESVVRNNRTPAFGGGIGTVGGTLTLIDSSVTDNLSGKAGGGLAHAGGEVTLVRSVVRGNATGPDFGGGGFGNGAETLTLIDSEVSGNSAGVLGGGGIGTAFGSEVWVVDSLISGNTTTGSGGGINLAAPAGGSVRLEGTIVSENTAGTTGGGATVSAGSVFAVRDSLFRNNSAAFVGGVANLGGSLTLEEVEVSGNRSMQAPGGGVGNAGGVLTIIDSTLDGNFTALDGGGVGGPGMTLISGTTIANNVAEGLGGGIGAPSGVYLVQDATVTGNTAGLGAGGIASAAALELRNSTISGNSTPLSGGGVGLIGTPESTILNNVTITANTADSDGDGMGDGGGVSARGGAIRSSNNLIAGNASLGGRGADCSGQLESRGYNLIQDPVGCTVVGDDTGNLTGLDPRLGPLTDNGGPTETHALRLGSPAIDAGNPDPPGSGSGTCETADQRGTHRPQDGDGDGDEACDIGAFEVGSFSATRGKLTGGGAIPSAAGSGGANFGFVVRSVTDSSGSESSVHGALVYADEAAGIRISGARFDQLAIDGERAEVTGTADVNGETMRIFLAVQDRGEPGREDTLEIEVLAPGGYRNGPERLSGGNIQVHD